MSQRQINAIHAKLGDKDREILQWVVKSFGLGDVSTFKPNRLRCFSNDFDDFLGMLLEGYGRADWLVPDERIARTDIGRLLQQRREIIEQIFNLNVAAGIEEH
jgi:hypothetical protein